MIRDVLEFVQENDVKFVRLAFCDLCGVQKNISIMPQELPRAFEEGIPFDAGAIFGFSNSLQSNLLLFPDALTLNVLPWRPSQGRVIRFFCEIRNPDGTPFWADGRSVLKNVIQKAQAKGYHPTVGTNCEFYLFKTDETGEPTRITNDSAGYLDVGPLDKGENIRREICLCLEEMGIIPEISYHEKGPGQNEIDFKRSDMLVAAEHFLTYKTVVKNIASQNGLFASFMPKPLNNQSGNGLRINLSFFGDEKQCPSSQTELCPETEGFVSGILERINEMTVFLNPTVNSYERLGSFEAPKYITWSNGNGSQLVQIYKGEGGKAVVGLRSPDSALNPYLAFSLILAAGLEGIEKGKKLVPQTNLNPSAASQEEVKLLSSLPLSLKEAIAFSSKSEFIRNVLGEQLVQSYLDLKKKEISDADASEDGEKRYNTRYFREL